MTRIFALSTACTVLSTMALVAVAFTASAQTSTTSTSTSSSSSSAGVLSTTKSMKTKPTSASADMINEAIQRSEARAAKEAATGLPQQWGSEESFTYNPQMKRFDKSMQ